MNEAKWLIKDKLCSFKNDTIRAELGPQIIELDCNKENLDDSVTAPHYQVGKIDAYGVAIGTNQKMNCVEWKAKHVPFLWKIYELQDIDGVDRFTQVKEFEDMKEAITFAEGLI